MKKWLKEEYEFEIEVIDFLRGEHTEHYCRNGEEIGDIYTCTYVMFRITAKPLGRENPFKRNCFH